MTGLVPLLLPILLSAVGAFLLSFIIHMATPWHRGDFAPLPNESAARDALRALAIPPGDYMVPRPSSPDDMRTAAFKEKMEKGPRIIMTVIPSGPITMGKQMGLWFGYLLVVNGFAACIGGTVLAPGAGFHQAFHFTALTAFIGYSLGGIPNSIWLSRSWVTTIKHVIDGFLFALITGAVFASMWPKG